MILNQIKQKLVDNSYTNIRINNFVVSPNSTSLEAGIYLMDNVSGRKTPTSLFYDFDFDVYVRDLSNKEAQDKAIAIFYLLDGWQSIDVTQNINIIRVATQLPQLYTKYENNITEYIIQCSAYCVDRNTINYT